MTSHNTILNQPAHANSYLVPGPPAAGRGGGGGGVGGAGGGPPPTKEELAWAGWFRIVLCDVIAAFPPACANARHGRRCHSRKVRSESSAAPPFSPPFAAPAPLGLG
jgi:hypothetical protein